ncbi:GFA family protein [Roseateles sp.]|uniref:GFA family protein n=1 Tax=Roseateles sp. TaxID=1971397 RepID=UPI0025DAFC68|nr:GFA family protein [Roseateles sp.]MBV8033952.1 GFA family protein [Roseateles sp.]
MKITGQCHCGNIRFTATADPTKVMVCHCSDCQVLSGAPFRAVLPVPVEQVEMQGTPKQYVKVAASGNRRAQAFCGDCGTQLFASEADMPRTLNIRLGCVNERAQLKPGVQVWRDSAMPWLHELDGTPAHTRGRDSPRV